MTRAAVNVSGEDGSLIDITSMGKEDVISSKVGVGEYELQGTYGMVPIPEGWGYVLNNSDSDKVVDIAYREQKLFISVRGEGGVPKDLTHSITLHILVEANPELEIPAATSPTPPNPEVALLATKATLRQEADYTIVPLQDAVDIEEASFEEESLLKEWKRYRIALNKVETQSGWPFEVVWPEKPTRV